jgi:hypothetical protein
MISVTPAWVPLQSDGEIRVEAIPQILKGAHGGMIVQYFAVISKATCAGMLAFPDALGPKVESLLKHLEIGTHRNKRRSAIRILGITKAVR